MRNSLAVSLALLFLTIGVSLASPNFCIGPVKREAGQRGTVLPPPGDPRYGKKTEDGTLTVRIDAGPRIQPSATHGTSVTVSKRSANHVFSVLENGKQISSFKFNFRSETTQCVTFDPFYETWRIEPATAVARCGC